MVWLTIVNAVDDEKRRGVLSLFLSLSREVAVAPFKRPFHVLASCESGD